VYLTRRHYMMRIFANVQHDFLLDSLYRSVSSKLDQISDDTNAMYSAHTTALIIFLTAVIAVFGVFGTYFAYLAINH
jgi:hypothetical protein